MSNSTSALSLSTPEGYLISLILLVIGTLVHQVITQLRQGQQINLAQDTLNSAAKVLTQLSPTGASPIAQAQQAPESPTASTAPK